MKSALRKRQPEDWLPTTDKARRSRRLIYSSIKCGMQGIRHWGAVLIAAKQFLLGSGSVWIVLCDAAVMTNVSSMHIAA